ncbi:MAG TPA: hypothetical protein VMA77_05315 [Solirubrobacteraceae bacterium]|nr:hypothetical protein [Solirubrobacteraceae bacterium]
MKTWMLPWLFPLGLLATVVAVTAFPGDEGLLLLAGALLLLVLIGSIVFPPRNDEGVDPDTHYWRLSDWFRGG